MSERTFCPSCGTNLSADAPVEIDGWRVTPYSAERYGDSVHVTPSQAIILHTLAAADGRPVSRTVLMERAGSESDHNVLAVMVNRLRKQRAPIGTMRSAGYYWLKSGEMAA